MNAPGELEKKRKTDLLLEPGRPMSVVLRERLQEKGLRFFANDNIAAVIESEDEIRALQAEVEEKMQAVLQSLVIDVEHDHNTRETARRVAKMYVKEVFSGRFHNKPAITAFPNVEQIDELMILGPMTVRSACSHHFCPIMGKLWVGILPKAGSRLIGLSKYARMADWIMSRPQIQEEAVKTFADMIEQEVDPAGLAIVMKAEHFCMHWRGVKDQSTMTSSVMRGALSRSDALRKEFLSLIN